MDIARAKAIKRLLVFMGILVFTLMLMTNPLYRGLLLTLIVIVSGVLAFSECYYLYRLGIDLDGSDEDE